jgi:hypothetical protein
MKKILASLCTLLFSTLASAQADRVESISPTLATVYTEVSINAPPERVWSVLRDFEKMGEWSTSLKSIRGDINNGATVQVEFQFGDQLLKPAHNLIYKEGEAFGWADPIDILPGLHDFHLYRVVAINANQTRFIQTDQFVGKNAQIKPVELAQQVLPLYQAFNLQLKNKVERFK